MATLDETYAQHIHIGNKRKATDSVDPLSEKLGDLERYSVFEHLDPNSWALLSNTSTGGRRAIMGREQMEQDLILEVLAAVDDPAWRDALLAFFHAKPFHGVARPLNEIGTTSLHIAAYLGRHDLLNRLVEVGGDPNVREKFTGLTPCHYAAEFSTPGTLNTLRDLGASITAGNLKGETPLQVAIQARRLENVEALVRLGAEQNPDRRSVMHDAARFGSFDAVVALANAYGNVGARDARGRSPMHEAALHGNVPAIVALRQCGAPLDAVDNEGRTPLHAATQCTGVAERSAAMQALLAMGKEAEAMGKRGETPLVYAPTASV